MKAITPKILQKLDNKLLYKSPQLWITKFHYAIPGSLALGAILYLITSAFGYNPENEIPNQWNSFWLLSLPTLAVFVYWFIIQSQYNVNKNFGRLTVRHDYQNFVSYLLIISSFFLIMLSVPGAQLNNVDRSVSDEQLKEDILTLNTGYPYFAGKFKVDKYAPAKGDSEKYKVATYSVGSYNYIGSRYDVLEEPFLGSWEEPYIGLDAAPRTVTRQQAEEEILAFVAVYNKYTVHKVQWNSDQVLSYYNGTSDSENRAYHFLEWGVDEKVEDIHELKFGSRRYFHLSIFDEGFLMVLMAVIGYLALLTWIFKNVHWKNFVAAGVTVVLTPMFMGITALILFELINVPYRSEEASVLAIIIVVNLALVLFSILPVIKRKFSSFGVICTILLQFWMPALIMIYGLIGLEMWKDKIYDLPYEYPGDIGEISAMVSHLLYYAGWAFIIITIPLFRSYYSYMWAFPKSK